MNAFRFDGPAPAAPGEPDAPADAAAPASDAPRRPPGSAGDAPAPAPADTGPAKRDLVAGLEKGLAVIAAFDHERPRMSISDVARHCGLTRAAARRYLITLEHLGFVRSERKNWMLTPKVLRLGQSYMHSARLPRIVEPALQRLALALKEASSAGVLDEADVLCIAATSAGRVVSSTLQPGTRVPAYCTANGRVLLAARPQAEVDAWIARQVLAPLTPHTVTNPQRLRIEIARARAQGHAVVDQELELGLRTLSVPLQNHRGDTLAALNISVHASRIGLDQLVNDYLPALRHAQAQLRTLL
ncbi:IclR family transcriptional regulator domain-containing protein [Piscinibacter sakaiensis]|uniref:Transcriptional regulator, IclR family n=1 Tax=Piscinibacter sakaiensis TaxID=1547922 RepID=A0A0K8P1Z9_PISS1|nr:IclR family transcriptional regulator C-terminal domain-containing protein [Piscinibacter sakaiensis]GAP36687.1 transcriptional regulator, IclR family [Piscinibacter sakaiensis]